MTEPLQESPSKAARIDWNEVFKGLDPARRTRIERAITQQDSLFRSIFNAAPLGIKLLDADGRIIRTNRAFERFLGYSQGELRGRRFSEFTHPADLFVAERFFRRLVEDEAKRFQLEKRYDTKEKDIVWANLYLTSVRTSEGSLQFVMAMVEDITARKKVELDLAEVRSRLLDGAELERLTLAQNLHDGPMQDLHSAQYQIQALVSGADGETAVVLGRILETIDSVLGSLRSSAKELRPPAIMDFGLARAIRSYTDDLRARHPGTRIDLALTDDAALLLENHRLALFRIFQQAVMNSILHGKAETIFIRLKIDPEEVILEIEDDGIGFEVPPNWIGFVRRGHYGLAGAAERVAALGGHFQVESNPGKGALLRVIIPGALEEDQVG